MTDSKGPLVGTPIAQVEEPLVETPIFVVENTVAAASDVVADASLTSSGPQVHRITKQSVPVSYRIMAEPKQSKARQSPSEQQAWEPRSSEPATISNAWADANASRPRGRCRNIRIGNSVPVFSQANTSEALLDLGEPAIDLPRSPGRHRQS